MSIKVNVLNNNVELDIEKGASLFEICQKTYSDFKGDIFAAIVDNELKELTYVPKSSCKVEFIGTTSAAAYRICHTIYQKGVFFLLLYAVRQILGEKANVSIKSSINENYYCYLLNEEVTDELLIKLENKMKDIVSQNLPIEKLSVTIEEGEDILRKEGLNDKADELRYCKDEFINIYKLNDYYDYIYGQMPNYTGVLKLFALEKKYNGFILRFPSMADPTKLSEFLTLEKLANVFSESNRWAKILNVNTVKSLNDIISNGKIQDLILISEALHEKKIANIADMIVNNKKNIVLIAGPSSSGKTTFANRLCIQLKVNGLKPHIISVDDYYVNRADTPLDEFGKPDYECLEAIDIKLFNQDMTALLRGENVQIPHYNFMLGQREYKGRFIKLNSDEILVIEGIHGLNEKLTELVPRENKFKIYISALTQLNINGHNRISTTDTRLIRRMVRDNQFRGFDALNTISLWESVLRGEKKNIFPFQEEADVMFNSALVYELSVLKQFVEPLLFKIDKSQPQYLEARRILRFLDSFLGVSSESIPNNSLIREFIGGSCFES